MGGFKAMNFILVFTATISPCPGSLNLLEDLPDDLVSADLRVGDDGSTEQASSSTTLQQQQQQQQQQNTPPVPSGDPRHAIPVPNSDALNRGPPLSISQPRSSISSPGDPTPTMPHVSSTPTHNVTSSAGHSMQGLPLQMMPVSSSVLPNQRQQMANYSMPISQFASSGMMNLPHPGMGHMGRPVPPHMPQQLRPTSHGVMAGPLRMGMGMPNQRALMAPNMSHHGGMIHPGVGVGGVVPHQNMVRGQMQTGPHQHPAGHSAVHGHHMSSGGVPTQLQVGRPNMGRHMIPRGWPLNAQPNVMGQRFSVMGVPRPHVPWGGVANNMQWGDSQWGDSQHLSGDTIQPRLHGGADPMMRPDHGLGGVGGASQVQLPPHTDVWGLGLKGVPPTAPVTNSAASMDCTLPGKLAMPHRFYISEC